MSKSKVFLVSYILDNQPQSSQVESESESLTPEQAKQIIQGQNPAISADKITDVQVQPLQGRDEEDTNPGHNIQHADL